MYTKMLLIRVACVLLLLVSIPINAAPVVVDAEVWASPRTGASISRLPGLGELLVRFNEDAGDRLIIRHPGGDEGVLRAQELLAWLVSLGVPAACIELRASASTDESISVGFISDETKQ